MRFRWVLSRVVTAVLLGASVAAAQSASDAAVLNRFKAAFLYHFTTYVTWPESTQDSLFVVGVLGDSPILPLLEELASTKEVGDRHMVVKQLASIVEVQDCQMLFVTRAFTDQAAVIDSMAAAHSVLTVSDRADAEDFIIRFILVDGKLKFAVDQEALRRADLRASAHLLKLAIAER